MKFVDSENMKIMMFPFKASRSDNPYINILSKSLMSEGCEVSGINLLLDSKLQAVHLHWLECPSWGRVASRLPLLAKVKAKIIIFASRIAKSRGKKIFWTVHNLKPHDFRTESDKYVYQMMVNEFLPLVTDVILMSEVAKNKILEAHPSLNKARHHIINHPHYETHFSQHGEKVPPELMSWSHYASPSRCLLNFGLIRPYKKIPDIIVNLKKSNADFKFIVAGKGSKNEEDAIRSAIGDSDKFLFINRRVTDEEIVGLSKYSDAILFNFEHILNSGSVLSSLSLGKKVIAPYMGSLPSLASDVGEEWLYLFEGKITDREIINVMQSPTISRHPDLYKYDPDLIAAQHIRAYFN